MIEGQEKIGKLGFDVLDQIEHHYGEDASKDVPNWKPPVVRQSVIGVEVEYTDEDGDRSTHLVYDYDEWRPFARQGLVLNLAKANGVLPR